MEPVEPRSQRDSNWQPLGDLMGRSLELHVSAPRLVLAYDSNPSSDGSVLVSATPPARHHHVYARPGTGAAAASAAAAAPVQQRVITLAQAMCGRHVYARPGTGAAAASQQQQHMTTAHRLCKRESLPMRSGPRAAKGCIIPICTTARAWRRSGANGASGARKQPLPRRVQLKSTRGSPCGRLPCGGP